MMPRMPPLLLRPIMPNEIEDMKISRKNHREFHHFASFAAKHTTNRNSPTMENMMLAWPTIRLFSMKAKSFTLGLCL